MSLNKVMMIGRLGKDPDVRYLDSGVAVATFSIATTERAYTAKNGQQVPERTEWHNVVLWRGLAETAEKYLKKGDLLYVEGKLRSRSYERPARCQAYRCRNLCRRYGNAYSGRKRKRQAVTARDTSSGNGRCHCRSEPNE